MKRLVAPLLLGLICHALPGHAAPRKPYGGELLVYVYGSALDLDPRTTDSAAEASIARAVFEPLFDISDTGSVRPNLAASEATFEDRLVRIKLRPDLVDHLGNAFDAQRVARIIRSWDAPESAARHLLLPVARASTGEPRVESSDPQTLVVHLENSAPHLTRMWASGRASLRDEDSPEMAGTGPFRVDSTSISEVILVPFLRHRRGRPYLDRVRIKPLSSRFAAGSIARKVTSAAVFGAEQTEPARVTAFDRPSLLLLSIGDDVQPTDGVLLATIAKALDRRALAERHLGPGTKVVETLLGDAELEAAPAAKELAASMQLTLLLSKESIVGHRFADRVQLKLLRAGIKVIIERLSPARLRERRLSRKYELMISEVLPDAPRSDRPVDDLHALLSFAASLGGVNVVAADARSLLAAPQLDPVTVQAFERRLRARLGVLPMAEIAAAYRKPRAGFLVPHLHDGTLDLENARRLRNPQKRKTKRGPGS